MQTKYRIYELSARAVASYAGERDGVYSFRLDRVATEKCKASAALHEQEGNALFFQIMCVLRGNDYREPRSGKLINDLADIIFYMNFEHIFDRRATQKKYIDRQRKAEDMFRPAGITLDFGGGAQRYVAFERSASMSRNSRLSFIRADLYNEVRRRIMMDMEIRRCQLSKLYAYNGLMLSGGVRVEGVRIEKPHRVIVVDNPVRTMPRAGVITVQDDGSGGSMRKFYPYETLEEVKVTCFDGSGLISKEYAKTIDKKYCGQHIHSSFQIRLPFVKGMLHQVDFKDFLRRTGTIMIQDIWGQYHSIDEVDIILTKSMFKCYSWLNENGMSWRDYWAAFKKYRHALYITNVSKEKPQAFTDLNYQLLATLSIQAEEFRPADLPEGWEHSPVRDERNWLTKQTELAYYNFCANERFRLDYFLSSLRKETLSQKSREYLLASALNKNPLLIHEPVFAKQLAAKAESILKDYAVGHLIVAGDNRYLSGDLLEFMRLLIAPRALPMPAETAFCDEAYRAFFAADSFLAPGAVYAHGENCTLLRNPHIARNEEVQLSVYPLGDDLREHYLGHLTDVVMVSSETLAAERLGGADYDGDLIRTITDPIVNACVRRNYEYDLHQMLNNNTSIPLLRIPSFSAPKRNADDWQARFETIRDTFSSRIGQICNAALDRSVIAYDENSDAEEKQRCRKETELLAILTGLEIDSAKTGIRPDLDEYLNRRAVKRSVFLQYKNLAEKADERRAWYEPTHREKLNAFFEKTDWSQVSSPIERLPYLAHQLKMNTPKIKPAPAADSELFIFAQDERWRERLDAGMLAAVQTLLRDYEACLSRIRACRVPVAARQKSRDIQRIFFSRGQEEIYDTDELYALFQTLPPEHIAAFGEAIREQAWHLMEEDERERFLAKWLPAADFAEYYDLLSDFRCGGYRLLADVVMDIDRENAAADRKQLFRDNDPPAFAAMMRAYAERPFARDYREAVTEQCRKLLSKIVKPSLAVPYIVALGRRDLLWELLPEQVERNLVEVRHA